MKTALLLLALLAAQVVSLQGDIRTRLWRRFPSCRGTLEDVYAGDETGFFHRIRFDAGAWGFTLLLDKSRGEEWVDIAAGGVRFDPSADWAGPISVGWLEADMGSGLVLSHPGSWSAPSELEAYKPPVIRDIVRTASSPGDCRGDPLTGASFSMSAAGLDLTLLAAISWKDASGDGHHRTIGEIEGRAAVRETLGALRVSRGWWGATAAAGVEEESGVEAPGWGRGGFDWDIRHRELRLTGEAAAGIDSTGGSVAGWAAASLGSDRYSQTLTVLRNPAGFPDERASAPVGTEGTGLSYGFRWKAASRLTLTGGAGAFPRDDGGLFRAALETSFRFPFRMDSSLGFRVSGESGASDWRGWLTCTWQPADAASLGMKLQLAGADTSAQGAASRGSGLGVTLKWEPAEALSARFVCAGFDTEDYSSRVYYAEPAFPGEFGSTALWGRGFLLGASLSVDLGGGTFVRGRISRLAVEGVQSLGSGWEKTAGPTRTEVGLQLDWELD